MRAGGASAERPAALLSRAFGALLVPVALMLSLVGASARPSRAAGEHSALVSEVAGRLESAIRADDNVKVRLEQVRLGYVVALEGEASWQSSVIPGGSQGWADLDRLHLDECRPLARLLPAAGPQERCRDVTVSIGARLIEGICEWDPSRVAVVLGHELAHVTQGHLLRGTDRPAGPQELDDLEAIATSREREFEADAVGVRYALEAGYADALPAATAFWSRMQERRPRRMLEPGGVLGDHPTHLERIEALQADPVQRAVWRATISFECGVDYLAIGDGQTGEDMFRDALVHFPDSAEVHANLGYSLILQYYLTMPASERAVLCAPVALSAFAKTRPRIRAGVECNRDLLRQAVEQYRTAMALDSSLREATSGLAAAIAMDTGASEDLLEEGLGYLEDLLRGLPSDAPDQVVTDALTNRALLRVRLHQCDPRTAFEEALSGLPPGTAPTPACTFGYGTALAGSDARDDLRSARGLLSTFLEQTCPDDYYYEIAESAWRGVRLRLGDPSTAPPCPPRPVWLRTGRVALGNGKSLFLYEDGDRALAALRQLGDTVVCPIASAPAAWQAECPAHGIRVWTIRNVVRAVFLDGPGAPAVELRSDRRGAGPRLTLENGSRTPANELGSVANPVRLNGRYYKLYTDLGLAVRADGSDASVVRGLALVAD